MPETSSTIAAQRKDLLRQVVFNRAGGIPEDQKLLFSAECGLTVHAFMAEFYAAALQEIDPVKADKVAEQLASYLDDGALPEYAWDRAEALGYDPQEWADEWDRIQAKRFPKPEMSQFRQVTCFELKCALCGDLLGEDGDGVEHHASQKNAEESALAQSWHKLADGRLICAAEDEEHSAALIEPEPHVEVDGQLPFAATSEEAAR
jgi:hypothetical protein